MSQKEVDRALILSKVKSKLLSLNRAAEQMSLSYPQTKRLWAKFKQSGPHGLISKKRGRSSNRAVSKEERVKILKIISERYQDCKPLFISEKLNEHYNINYSSEFIRQLMIEYHLWIPKKNKSRSHPRRPRRKSEGELIQGDASDHEWFEARGPRCSLHLFVDDATSKLVGGYFTLEETTEGYYRALLPLLEKHGRPISLYTDKRGTFVVNQGKKGGETQFSRAMKELGIHQILAHSPQAKGRIERAFGTLQERLVWEMRDKRISTIEEANEYLPEFFIEYNKKFAERPFDPFNAYRPLDQKMQLKYILSMKEERVVSKNLEVNYQNKVYQLSQPEELEICLKRSKVTVITTLDGEVKFQSHGHILDHVCYSEQEYQKPEITTEVLANTWKTRGQPKKKPSKHHPWKQNQKVA